MAEQGTDANGNFVINAADGTNVLRIGSTGNLALLPTAPTRTITLGAGLRLSDATPLVLGSGDATSGSIRTQPWGELQISAPSSGGKAAINAATSLQVNAARTYLSGELWHSGSVMRLFENYAGYAGVIRRPRLSLQTRCITSAANDFPMNAGNYTDGNHYYHEIQMSDEYNTFRTSYPGPASEFGPLGSQTLAVVQIDKDGVRAGGSVVCGSIDVMGRGRPGRGAVRTEHMQLSGVAAGAANPASGAVVGMTTDKEMFSAVPSGGRCRFLVGGTAVMEVGASNIVCNVPITGPGMITPRFSFPIGAGYNDVVVNEVLPLESLIPGGFATRGQMFFPAPGAAVQSLLLANGQPFDSPPAGRMRLAFIGGVNAGGINTTSRVEAVWLDSGSGNAARVPAAALDGTKQATVNVLGHGARYGSNWTMPQFAATPWFDYPSGVSIGLGLRVSSITNSDNGNAVTGVPFRFCNIVVQFM